MRKKNELVRVSCQTAGEGGEAISSARRLIIHSVNTRIITSINP